MKHDFRNDFSQKIHKLYHIVNEYSLVCNIFIEVVKSLQMCSEILSTVKNVQVFIYCTLLGDKLEDW